MMNAAAYVTDLQLRKILKENAGLGTEATRAGIIEQLLSRRFITLKGSKLLATDLGADVIDALPPQLTDPGMTALWEQALDEVAAGRMNLNDFLQRQTAWTSTLVSQGMQQHISIRVPPSPPCPLCGSKTVLRKSPKGEYRSCTRYPECKGIISLDTGRRKSSGRAKSPKTKRN